MNDNAPSSSAEHIDGQLRELAQRLAAVSNDFAVFAAARRAPTAGPVADNPPPVPRPRQEYPPQYAPPPVPQRPYPQQPQSGQPYPHRPYLYPPQLPQPSRRPAAAPGERLAAAAERGLIGRVLAVGGAVITLVGVVLLLVLAAQAGLLRPEVRVAGGAVFAVALVAAGAHVGGAAERRTGAIALVATGVAAGLFDTLAASSIYHWLPATAAIAVGAAITAGGAWQACRWDSQALCVLVSVPLLVFAPIVTAGVDETLIGATLAYAAAMLWPQVRRDWTALFLVNTAAATLPLLFAGVGEDLNAWFVGAAVAAGLTLALASAVILLPSSTRGALLGLGSAIAALPVFTLPTVLDRPMAAVVAGVCTALLAAAAFGTAHRTAVPVSCRITWVSAAAVTALAAIAYASSIDAVAPALLSTAVVMGLATHRAGTLRRVLLIIATVFGATGLAAMIYAGAITQLTVPGGIDPSIRASMLISTLVAIAAAAALTAAWADDAGTEDGPVWIAGGVVMLSLVTQLCISTADLITGGTDGGFRGGHTAATLVWFATAAAALLWARSAAGRARTVALATGLVVIAAGVAKLLLFDLAALSGMFRVIAFVAAGLVLLALGVAYAQRLTGEGPDRQPAADTAGPRNL
ncbi:DUF2339 domain-containing protein [Tomitella cavernea]|uniref:DUF2339 domain-containing protein n=1 Tax=Tomitella cavernea TaxID=1387982 RepID=UPI0019077B9A|nr:DUF2339 domain-containing protein [Tomitella cavernea]